MQHGTVVSCAYRSVCNALTSSFLVYRYIFSSHFSTSRLSFYTKVTGSRRVSQERKACLCIPFTDSQPLTERQSCLTEAAAHCDLFFYVSFLINLLTYLLPSHKTLHTFMDKSVQQNLLVNVHWHH